MAETTAWGSEETPMMIVFEYDGRRSSKWIEAAINVAKRYLELHGGAVHAVTHECQGANGVGVNFCYVDAVIPATDAPGRYDNG